MELKLNPSEIQVIKSSGVALLGEANQVVDDCVIPNNIDQNHGYAPGAIVFLNNEKIGKIASSKIKKGKLYYGVKLNKPIGDGIYVCEFDINKMFSSFTGSKFVLEEIIIDSINIIQLIETNRE